MYSQLKTYFCPTLYLVSGRPSIYTKLVSFRTCALHHCTPLSCTLIHFPPTWYHRGTCHPVVSPCLWWFSLCWPNTKPYTMEGFTIASARLALGVACWVYVAIALFHKKISWSRCQASHWTQWPSAQTLYAYHCFFAEATKSFTVAWRKSHWL